MPMLENKEIDNSRITAVFKGEPKTGKSIAAASFPKPMYIFDLEDRMKPLLTYYAGTDMLKGIEYDTYGAYDFKLFDKKVEEILKSNKYATVMVDSLTTLSNMIMAYMLELRGASGKRANGKEYRHAGVIPLPEIEDFGGEAQALQDMVDFGRSLNCNFILTAHVVEVVNQNLAGESIVTRSMLTAGRKIAARLPACFDEIWHFGKKASADPSIPPKFEIYTQNTGIDFAGTALPLPFKIDWTGNRDLHGTVLSHIRSFLGKHQGIKAPQSTVVNAPTVTKLNP